MSDSMSYFINVWLKFFFLFTPFFAITMFLSMTTGYTEAQRRKVAIQTSGAVGVLCFGLYFFGNFVFSVFGITLDAFRVGAGALLFLSAVRLVQAKTVHPEPEPDEDITVVPLAMPIIVGPATIGTLLVMGAEVSNATLKGVGCLALVAAIVCVGILLLLGSWIEGLLGKRGLNILSKVTGLILSALAAQMILMGFQHFLGLK